MNVPSVDFIFVKGSTCSECIHDYARSHATTQITNIMIRCLTMLECRSSCCSWCHVLPPSVSRASVYDGHVLAIRHNFPKNYSTTYDDQYTQLMSTCVIVIHIIAWQMLLCIWLLAGITNFIAVVAKFVWQVFNVLCWQRIGLQIARWCRSLKFPD